ncbi:potassium channel family protein [Blastococcus xanthinilyticus]|uniref:Ion channel n=1 Tax=Blastococcus xanthinilyticus TaxID=1564164 RepID=A0A5S5CZU9_9ACTN|nr:potassium channel family protein [Blastococcus xanthinilyticus]TYP88604.1 ion channel [Blastococcus xanthinilyticus]
MADTLLIVAGVLLVLAVYGDALATTLTVGGAGPLTRTVLARLWRLLLGLHRPDSSSKLLTGAGAGLLFTTVLLWVAGIWAGWTLVFAGSDTVVDAQTSLPAGFADVAYYAGFTVFTLGVGDFTASDPAGRFVTALASFGGLFLITLAITYLLSVIGAVVERRAIAVRINALGRSSGEIVAKGWNGSSFSSAFVQQLVALTGQLSTTAEQHLAYPVLHYFRSGQPNTAAPVAVGRLDDAMLLLRAGVAPDARPDDSAVDPVRDVIARYLETASATSTAAPAGTPPAPDLAALRAAGIPAVTDEEFARAAEDEEPRRRLLHQLVKSNGWSW